MPADDVLSSQKPIESIDGGIVNSRALTHASVVDLFGRYSYELPIDVPELDSQLNILYGENGAGKTTILNVVHNAISHAAGRGHKTKIAQIPLKMFKMRFNGDIELNIYRQETFAATFSMELKVSSRVLGQVDFVAKDGKVPTESDLSDQQDEFTALVRSTLGLDSYFLGDERTLDSDIFTDDDDDTELLRINNEFLRFAARRDLKREPARNSQLLLAMERAKQWARSQALSGANIGSENANTIYAQVVRQLSTEPTYDETIDPLAEQVLRELITQLASRSADQSEFGLIPSIDASEFLKGLHDALPERRPLIVKLLQPYVDGIRARLDAMEGLYSLLKAFTQSLNSFLIDKEVRFDIRRGVVVLDNNGADLSPEKLSSGEKQLLMLLCNLIISRQRPSLFLIDEPELSLNVKWQRKLIPALLACTSGSQIQLIMATHSIELLTGYRDNVIRLPFGVE